MSYTIMIDPGHGGSNPGATFQGRLEKDDALALSLAIGSILEASGINVLYTRTADLYETPFQKAQDGNLAGADLFLSIHRNSSLYPEMYAGVESLVYNDIGVAGLIARNINSELEKLGFRNIGVSERPNLIVLNSSNMPAVLVEVGFINTESDNQLFDSKFDAIAQAVADGVLESI
ncbi:MAG: N-acetylmuramoyl-L-alanine amidase [Lachnospiraceae bacterium]